MRSRFEKKSWQRLRGLGFDACAPTQWKYRRWGDCCMKVEVVLFSNYIFIAADPARYNEAFRAVDEEGILSSSLAGYRGIVTGLNSSRRLQVALPGLHCFAQVELRDTEVRSVSV